MALAVASYAEVSNWFSTGASKSVSGLSWNSGDRIVVVGHIEDSSFDVNTPTNTNLTFGLRVSEGTTTGAPIYIWTDVAGSNQTSQTITATPTNTTIASYGFATYIISGDSTGEANASSSTAEATMSKTVAAGSIVIYGFSDWNADNTARSQTAGSGTATERYDTGDGVNYGVYGGQWVNTAATTASFGITDYTTPTLDVSQAFIEILAPTTTPSTVPRLVRNRRLTTVRM